MSVEAEIRRRIGERGAITFAEFMELALFWRYGGYYLAGNPIGHAGDFYTSPQVHPVFGAMLALQLYQMWQVLDQPNPFTVVEQGAGNGLLCRDVAVCARDLPAGFCRSLRYLCLERRAGWGVEATHRSTVQISRVTAAEFPFKHLLGCILSNEFLDSFPVHQVTMRQGVLQEVCVILNGEDLETCLGEPSTPALAARLGNLGIELKEGQTAEINLGLDGWTETVAASLEAGFVLSVDYGDTAAGIYSPERRYRGALTTYYRHMQTDDPLRHIGHQDITSQVDFTSAINAGHRVGLEPLGYLSQGQFLRNLGIDRIQRRLTSLGLVQRDADANRAGMLDLTRAGGLGEFKVLIQAKGVDSPSLWGLKATAEATALADQIPVPLLTPKHLSLLEGMYPDRGYGLERY